MVIPLPLATYLHLTSTAISTFVSGPFHWTPRLNS